MQVHKVRGHGVVLLLSCGMNSPAPDTSHCRQGIALLAYAKHTSTYDVLLLSDITKELCIGGVVANGSCCGC